MSKTLILTIGSILLLTSSGCAISASGMGIEVRWVIGDASIACDWDETGYPSGDNCLVGGGISVEAAGVLGGGTEEVVEDE